MVEQCGIDGKFNDSHTQHHDNDLDESASECSHTALPTHTVKFIHDNSKHNLISGLLTSRIEIKESHTWTTKLFALPYSAEYSDAKSFKFGKRGPPQIL